MITGDLQSNQARASCDAVTDSAAALASICLSFPAASGYQGMNAIFSRLAVVDDVIRTPVRHAVLVLNAYDRHDRAGVLDLLDADFGKTDVLDLSLRLEVFKKAELVGGWHGRVDAVKLK